MVVYPMRSAMIANNSWRQHNALATKALERVTSGKRINRAADDPAGLSVSENMRAQLTILARQQEIALDHIGLANTEDGNLSSVQDMMNRMQVLSVQAAGDTLTEQDRKNLDIEYQEMLKGIGSFHKGPMSTDLKIFSDSAGTGKAAPAAPSADAPVAPAEAPPTRYTIDLADYLDQLDRFMTGENAPKPGDVKQAVADFTKNYLETRATAVPSTDSALLYTIAVTEGNISLQQKGGPEMYGLEGTNILTQEGARAAQEALKGAQEKLLTRRATVGALQKRLEHTVNSLRNMEEGLTASYSRIVDADIAKEYTNYVREQMLSQVSNLMLSHINSDARQVLNLLP